MSELVRRGRGGGDDLVKEIESLLGKAGAATKRARGSDPVDRIVRGADRARRAAGVGPSFPILGYDDLNAVAGARPGSRTSRSPSCARC